MAVYGSPEYVLTWKHWDMESGPPICALRASARRTSDNACTGWPTPKAQEDGRTLDQYERGRLLGYERRKGKTSGGPASAMGGLAIAAQLAGWPTPQSLDTKGPGNPPGRIRNGVERTTGDNDLPSTAMLVGWPSPQASWAAAGSTSRSGDRKDEPLIGGLVRALAGWPTCTVQDAANARNATAARSDPDSKHHAGLTLVDAVTLAGWCTPTTGDGMRASETYCRRNPTLLGMARGTTPASSPAGTASGGGSVLNPAFPRWLMAFPARWDSHSPGFMSWAVVQSILDQET